MTSRLAATTGAVALLAAVWHAVPGAPSRSASASVGGPSVPTSAAVPVPSPTGTSSGHLPASVGAARAGTVEGVVRLESIAPESPPMLSPYARRRYRPPSTTTRGQSGPENVVVYVPVDGARGGSPTGAAPAVGDGTGNASSRPTSVITQRDRTIIPHVTVVPVGTRIVFPNEDDVFHNLFSLSDPGPFNLGRYPPGESRSETFDRPGVIRMFCDIHSEMTAVIRVMDTPHFTRPAADGSFRLTGVPDGVQTVVAWHDQLGADTVQVRISPSLDARVELQLPR